MKKLFALLTIVAVSIGAIAQPKPRLLESYLNLKNALVASDYDLAAESGKAFVTALGASEAASLSATARDVLAKEAQAIADGKNIAAQRDHFALLSTEMIAAVKDLKSPAALYVQYCPMKKSSWLSAEKEIRNPYYGSAMLTCGSVSQVIE